MVSFGRSGGGNQCSRPKVSSFVLTNRTILTLSCLHPGIAFAGSQLVFAGYSGAPFSNRAFNLRLRAACRAVGVGEITAHGLRHSAATILLNHVGKDLREIQELLRHKNIRTTVRYTHVGYEQTRQTAEALSQTLQ
jgi:integrase/recombinase XerC